MQWNREAWSETKQLGIKPEEYNNTRPPHAYHTPILSKNVVIWAQAPKQPLPVNPGRVRQLGIQPESVLWNRGA